MSAWLAIAGALLALAAPLAEGQTAMTDKVVRVGLLLYTRPLNDPVGQGLLPVSLGLAATSPDPPRSFRSWPRSALFKEAVPKMSRVAVLKNAANPGNVPIWKEVQVAGRTLGVTVHAIDVRGPDDLQRGLGAMIRDNSHGFLVLDDPVFIPHRASIVEFAAKHRLPAIYPFSEYADVGGLMTYSVSLSTLARPAVITVDKILRGAKPSELPIEPPTTFEMVINLRTAKALKLTMPQTVLQRADRVIE